MGICCHLSRNMAYVPSTPPRIGFSFGAPGVPQTFGTPTATLAAPTASANSYKAPKYSEAAMRMGLAKSSMPPSIARPVVYKRPKNNNVMETRVLGAFNGETGKGWVESTNFETGNAVIKRYSRKGRRATRRNNKRSRSTRRVGRR
jgi:hypothetical protein